MGVFLCYGFFEPLSNKFTQFVRSRMAYFESVKVVLNAYLAGKPAILATDTGRRLLPMHSKPSFQDLEKWIADMGAK